MPEIPMKGKIRKYYDELEKIRKKLDQEPEHGASGTFKTYVGDDVGKGGKKLMVVGKATGGWSTNANSHNFVMDCVAAGKYSSAFWSFACQLSGKLNGIALSDPHYREKTLGQIVWSNIMKIGVEDGNPWGKVHECQKDVCERLLHEEIRFLEPERLVFVTGWDYRDEIKKILGHGEYKELSYHVWYMRHDFGDNCQVFWTRHPQGWPLDGDDGRDQAVCHITKEDPPGGDWQRW